MRPQSSVVKLGAPASLGAGAFQSQTFSEPRIAHVLGGDATRGRDNADGLAIATVEGKGDADFLAIVAADLEAV